MYKNKHKVKTLEITSTKMKHSNFLVLAILLFLSEHYRKTKGKKIKQEMK